MNALNMLKNDKSLIIYRPELKKITGSINSAILLNQIIYWYYNKKGDGVPFYKFREPCDHDRYEDGDSWCEELGFSKAEFNTAIKKIGYKENSEYNQLKKEEALVWYQKKAYGITYYEINEELLAEKLDELYFGITPEKDESKPKPQRKKKSSVKATYPDDFEVLWQLYNKKTSNKAKSYDYYVKLLKGKYEQEQLIKAIELYKKSVDREYMKDFNGFLNGLIESFIPKMAWVIDATGKKWHGMYYDSENKFESDNGKILTLKSEMVAKYITEGRFGYY